MIASTPPTGPSLSTHSAVSFGFNTIPSDGWEGGHPAGGQRITGIERIPVHLAEDVRVNLTHPEAGRRLACIRRIIRAQKQAAGEELTRAQRRRKIRREEGYATCSASGVSRGGAGASLLEPMDNEVETGSLRSELQVSSVRCKRHVCGCCGKSVGMMSRHRMLATIEELQRRHGTEGDAQMWTLTVDPSRYASPEAAWEDVGKRRRIGETMRAMGVRYYVVVLEWHKSGWPHWHVLIWRPVAKMRLDHAQMTRAWGLGHTLYRCRYRDKKGRPLRTPKPMAWAVRYITKYLVKGDVSSVPAWVGERSRVRMIWGSRAWGPVVSSGWSCPGHDDGPEGEEDKRAPARSNREAVASCGKSVTLMRRTVDVRTGEERWTYIGTSEVPWRTARKLVQRLVGTGPAGRSSARVKPGPVADRLVRALLPGSGGNPRPMLN